MNRSGIALLALSFAVASTMSGCGDPGPGEAGGEGGAADVDAQEIPQVHEAPGAEDPPVDLPVDLPGELPSLRAVPSEPVREWTGPGGEPFEVALRTAFPERLPHLQRQIGRRSFALGLRPGSPGLTQYPCVSCHEPGGELDVPPDRENEGHAQVEAVHPRPVDGACSACHATDVERLRLPDGETVTLDHAYRVCAQCHDREVESWAAGIHGKRLDGWRDRRVVMGCSDCHDPHRPALEKRLPYPGPVIPRTGERDR